MDLLFSLSASLLVPGKSIPWDIYDAQGILLLKQGSVIASERQLEQILARGASTKVPVRGSSSQLNSEPDAKLHPFIYWHVIETELSNLYAITEPADFLVAAQDMVQFISRMTKTNPNGSMAAMLLNRPQRYPVSHALHVAVIAAVVGRKMDMDINALIAAALTMNLSIMDLQLELYRQATPLTPEQQDKIRRHPIDSANMLVHRGVTSANWLRAVAEHHEPDYPTGNPGHQDSMLLHITDIYTAKFSGRSYRVGISPEEAILSTLRPFKEHRVMHQLLRTVGLFPPGLLVKLADGSLGIVLRATEEYTVPYVAQVVDKGGHLTDGKKRLAIPKDKILAVVPRSKVAANFPYSELYNEFIETLHA